MEIKEEYRVDKKVLQIGKYLHNAIVSLHCRPKSQMLKLEMNFILRSILMLASSMLLNLIFVPCVKLSFQLLIIVSHLLNSIQIDS